MNQQNECNGAENVEVNVEKSGNGMLLFIVFCVALALGVVFWKNMENKPVLPEADGVSVTSIGADENADASGDYYWDEAEAEAEVEVEVEAEDSGSVTDSTEVVEDAAESQGNEAEAEDSGSVTDSTEVVEDVAESQGNEAEEKSTINEVAIGSIDK